MEPNQDLIDVMIAHRQQAIRDGVTEANRSRPLAQVRRVTGRALIAIGEHLRGDPNQPQHHRTGFTPVRPSMHATRNS